MAYTRLVRAYIKNTPMSYTSWIPESTAILELNKMLNEGEEALKKGEHIVYVYTDHDSSSTEAIALIENSEE